LLPSLSSLTASSGLRLRETVIAATSRIASYDIASRFRMKRESVSLQERRARAPWAKRAVICHQPALQQRDVAMIEADIFQQAIVEVAQGSDLAAARTGRQGDIEQEMRQQREGVGLPENAHDASAWRCPKDAGSIRSSSSDLAVINLMRPDLIRPDFAKAGLPLRDPWPATIAWRYRLLLAQAATHLSTSPC
jgi:hypothetical protein